MTVAQRHQHITGPAWIGHQAFSPYNLCGNGPRRIASARCLAQGQSAEGEGKQKKQTDRSDETPHYLSPEPPEH
jgi:hypothetical protein